MLRYAKAIADMIYKGFCWVFHSFFADALPRQTEDFWVCLHILLLMYLAPEFLKAVNKCNAFSSSLLHAIITCNHLLLFKIFSNFEYFCLNFQIFCLFLAFLAFAWKIRHMPLFSRIAPDTCPNKVPKIF